MYCFETRGLVVMKRQKRDRVPNDQVCVPPTYTSHTPTHPLTPFKSLVSIPHFALHFPQKKEPSNLGMKLKINFMININH
jgi:hypothetical protein